MTRALLLAALGGVLHFLGFLGFGWWPLALGCLVPLWLALDAARAAPGRAALIGLAFGWTSYAGGFWWLWSALDVFFAGNRLLGGAVWLADSLWFALRYALYAVLFALLRRRRPPGEVNLASPVAIAGVAPLVLIEWLYPMLFPVYFGHALAERTALVQMTALGGPLLLTAFAALVNAAVYEAGWGGGRARRATLAAAAVAGLAAWLWGRAQLDAVTRLAAAAPPLRVGIVQGNLGVQEKGVRAVRDHQQYLAQTRELLAAGPLDLVVWPETVYTRGLRGPLPVSGFLVRGDLDVPLLFGAALVRGEGQRRAYNAALLVGRDGTIASGYAKNLLIPFTEYVPFAALLPGLAARVDVRAHFSAAADTPAVVLDGVRFATPICYEAVRPAFVRRMMRAARPHVLVTLANDAWFGDSQGAWLHLAMARLRAIEHRRWLVRATNSGVSAVVDPAGRLVARTGLQTRETLRAVVVPLDGTTPYTRLGDWPGWVAAAVLAWAARRR